MHEMKLKNMQDIKTYNYTVGNLRGEENRGMVNVITIEFVDGKFSEVMFPFSKQYNREEWRVLAAIEAQITEIEKELENKHEG